MLRTQDPGPRRHMPGGSSQAGSHRRRCQEFGGSEPGGQGMAGPVLGTHNGKSLGTLSGRQKKAIYSRKVGAAFTMALFLPER